MAFTIKTGVVVVAFATVLSGCSSTWEQSNTPKSTPAAPTVVASTPDQIQIVTGTPTRAYDVLKQLKVTVNKTTAFHPNPTQEQVLVRLREDAAKLGADALLNAVVSDVKIGALSWGVRTGTATAIKYR